jgi:hypothetical protein
LNRKSKRYHKSWSISRTSIQILVIRFEYAYGFAAKERDESGFCNVFMFQTPPGTKALSLGDGEYDT